MRFESLNHLYFDRSLPFWDCFRAFYPVCVCVCVCVCVVFLVFFVSQPWWPKFLLSLPTIKKVPTALITHLPCFFLSCNNVTCWNPSFYSSLRCWMSNYLTYTKKKLFRINQLAMFTADKCQTTKWITSKMRLAKQNSK